MGPVRPRLFYYKTVRTPHGRGRAIAMAIAMSTAVATAIVVAILLTEKMKQHFHFAAAAAAAAAAHTQLLAHLCSVYKSAGRARLRPHAAFFPSFTGFSQ